MTVPIQLHMVRSIAVSIECSKARPCEHSCTITLYCDIEKKAVILSDELAALIHSSVRSKIECSRPHFAKCKASHLLPAQILTKLWNQVPAEEHPVKHLLSHQERARGSPQLP